MRTSYLKPVLEAEGASFEERCGTEIVSAFSDISTEYSFVRDSVGLTDFSFAQIYRIPEETAVDFLDSFIAGNVARTRFGRMIHTFIADDEGNILSDCFIANNDEEFILICESIVDSEEIDRILDSYGAKDAQVEKLSDTHVLLALDGLDSWKVAKDMFGEDVLGLPYLSVKAYPFEDEDILLFRAGKTSEFGYMFLAPNEMANALFEKTHSAVKDVGGGLCGVEVHNTLRLEGRFFNIFKEGVEVRDPLVLGLQWMIDFDKEEFRGSKAIYDRRASGLKKKIIGVSAASGCDELKPDAEIYHEGESVAKVAATCHSNILDRKLGLAVFPVELAYSGLDFMLGAGKDQPVKTISMPPILPKSLTIRLDEM